MTWYCENCNIEVRRTKCPQCLKTEEQLASNEHVTSMSVTEAVAQALKEAREAKQLQPRDENEENKP